MADYIKDFISDAVNNGLKGLNSTLKQNGASVKIDSNSTGKAAYESITSTICPTKQQKVTSYQNKITDAQLEIQDIQKSTKNGILTAAQQTKIANLQDKIENYRKNITTLEKEIAQEKVAEAQKAAANATKKTSSSSSKSTAEMQKEIDANLKTAQSDMLVITIANAAKENEDSKKENQTAKELQEKNAELTKQKNELKKQIDDIEAIKKNGVILSSEQEEQLALLKKQYNNFDSEIQKNSIEAYIVTTYNSEKIISDLETSFLSEFNSVLSGELASVLKTNAYGGLTSTLADLITDLGTGSSNKKQVISVNANTKKKLQLDASTTIKDTIKNATDTNISNLVSSVKANGVLGKALAPSLEKTLTRIQTDTITKVTYGAMDVINKNEDLVKAAQYYYTYQQIQLLAQKLSFKNISNLLINTAKQIWVKQRDKLIKDITSKISISASGVKISL